MSRIERIGNATLYLADCLEVLPTLGEVDAVVTSPPYAQQRDYGCGLHDWDHMMSGLLDFPKCQALINLGQIHRNGEVVMYWEPWRDRMRAHGWRFFAQYVWDQGSGLPGDFGGRLCPSHEYVLHFNGQSKPVNKWVKTLGRTDVGGSMRVRSGNTPGKTSPHLVGQATKTPDSVLRLTRHVARNGAEATHPAVFPVSVPEHLMMSFTDKGQSVLDPFMGSGTTGVACANLGRAFIGIEIDPGYFDIACERVEMAQAQGRLFA